MTDSEPPPIDHKGLDKRAAFAKNSPEVLEHRENDKFISERFQGGESFARETEEDIIGIYRTVFSQFTNTDDPTIGEYINGRYGLESDLTNESANFVVLRDKQNNKIVGFTYFKPNEESRQTVEVGATAILENFRNQGGWTLMMENLESGIAANSRFKRMERVVRTAEGYADRVRERYQDGITHEQLVEGYGRQIRFTIQLDKLSLPITQSGNVQ